MKIKCWIFIAFIALNGQCFSMQSVNNFTQENQLNQKLAHEISHFWQQGEFSSFRGIDNIRINYAAFVQAKYQQCLVISPGRSEGYLKYKELAYDLAQQGFNIFIIDHRGQGLSQRMLTNPFKGYVKNFDDYSDDLEMFIKQIVIPSCDNSKPMLLAHSMGGAIAIRLMQRSPKLIKSAVLSSPMIAINSGSIPTWLSKAFIYSGSFINHLFAEQAWYFIGQQDYQASAFTDNPLTHSVVRHQNFLSLYQEQPELQLGGVTIQWLKQAIEAQQSIFKQIDQIKTPVLVLQAGAESIVDNAVQNEFCQQLAIRNDSSCIDGKPLIIKDAKHELFFEQDHMRNKALDATINWFNKKH